MDAAGCYQHMSEAYRIWSGRSREFYIGKHFSLVLPLLFDEPYLSRFLENARAALSAGMSTTCEGRLKTGRYVQANWTPDFAEDGRVQGVLVIKTDVTSLRNARNEALESRERLQLAASGVGMGIWSNDLTCGEVAWDDACFQLVGVEPRKGYTFAEFRELIHPDDRQRHIDAFAKAQRGEAPYESEYRVLLSDGSCKWLLSRGRVIRDEIGKPIRMLGVVFDITRQKAAEQQAREQQERIHQILESTSDGVIMLNEQWVYTYLNSNASRMISGERNLLGERLWDAFPGIDETEIGRMFRATMEDGESRNFEDFYPTNRRWYHCHAYRTTDGLVCFFNDVTEHRNADRSLRLHRQVMEAVPVGITIAEFDAEKDFPLIYANPAFEAMTGYAESEILGRNCRFLRGDERGDASSNTVFEAVKEGRSGTFVTRNFRKDGGAFLNEVQLSPVPDATGRFTHIVGIQTDVTERVETRRRLAHQAQYDALTGIPNRYLFTERLRNEMERARKARGQLAVIYIDVDNLKHVNDSLGHREGDRLLQEVASRIASTTRQQESLGRLGGDEFALFCTNFGEVVDLERLMGRLIQRLGQPMELGNRQWTVTGSAGYALFPRDAHTAEELVRMADLAMYAAKRESKNTWRAYQPAFDQGTRSTLDIASGLRRAVAENEFYLLYQPRIDAATGRLRSMEALIRWNHPQHGVLLPAQFILTAEETGAISEIGLWVIKEAIRQNLQWSSQRRDIVPISVNVSPVQFRSHNFACTVVKHLHDAGLPPSMLELEVTESLLMEETSSVEPLRNLRSNGVRISIDDFGTGYSGLGYLSRFPVDTLKLDRSFTQHICEQEGAAIICSSVLQLGNRLGMNTVAEGVEHEAQATLLRQWGCTELQGHYFGRPMPPSQIERMLLGA